jgi:hypothetical protein
MPRQNTKTISAGRSSAVSRRSGYGKKSASVERNNSLLSDDD